MFCLDPGAVEVYDPASMQTFLLLLALTFASDPISSEKVEVYKAGDNDYVTIQSVRDDDEYQLRIEITSATWQVGHGPCNATFEVDNHSLAVPCTMPSSQEVIRPRTHDHFIVETVIVSDTTSVEMLLNGSAATIEVGSYNLKLTKSHLRQLRTVLKE